jgi:DNA-binding MarR family transcriptional regulator
MTQTRISGKFYPLKSEEWLDSINQLTHSELKILYYVRSLDPYNNGIEITPSQIARDLSVEKNKMHRSTVGRALKSLDKKGFINMELIKIRIKVNPKGFLAEPELKPEPKAKNNDVVATQPCCDHATNVVTTQHRVQPHNTECAHATQSAPTQQPKAETQSEQELENSKIFKTYLDFKKTLSESERENFLNFVKEKTNNLERPINDLEAWLASKNAAKQNRWEIYYKNYQEAKINGTHKTTRHSENGAGSALEAKNLAIAKFRQKMRIDELVNEPEDTNSDGRLLGGNLPTQNTTEEFQRQQAEFNKLLDNPPEPGESGERKSLAQQRREQIAEARRQQEEWKRANKEAADERAEQQNFDIDGYQAEIQRQIEEFNRLHNIGKINENDEENLEDE